MTVRITKNKMSRSLGQIEQRIDRMPKQAFAFWRKITPKRSGNAKRKTILQGNTIRARYPYAQRLDEGWSKKAPQGMYKPTLEYLKKIGRKAIRK